MTIHKHTFSDGGFKGDFDGRQICTLFGAIVIRFWLTFVFLTARFALFFRFLLQEEHNVMIVKLMVKVNKNSVVEQNSSMNCWKNPVAITVSKQVAILLTMSRSMIIEFIYIDIVWRLTISTYLKSTVPKMSFKLIWCSGTNVKIKIIKMKYVYDISDI